MKRNTLLSLGWSLCAMAQGQVWCPPGANWHHEWFTLTEIGYLETQYMSDTIIDGSPSQKISATKHVYDYVSQSFLNQPLAPYFTSVANDLVSILTPNGFDTLYRFDAIPGDSWSVPLANDPTDLLVIDTGTVNIDGLDLRYLVVEYQPGGWPDTLIEGIGGVWAYMDGSMSQGIDAPALGLRCYQDQDISFSTGIAAACDFILGINQSGSSPTFSLYPNPANSSAKLVWNDPSGRPISSKGNLLIFNAQGSFVRSVDLDLSGGEVLINLHGLPTGLFTLRLQDHQSRWSSAKLTLD